MKLLIVDDSRIFREKIKTIVNDFISVEVVGEAENGLEALQLVAKYEPDFIFLDIRMPSENGIETLKKIKEQGSKAIVCILTNYDYRQYRKKCLAEGADYFLSKAEAFDMIRRTLTESFSKMQNTNNEK